MTQFSVHNCRTLPAKHLVLIICLMFSTPGFAADQVVPGDIPILIRPEAKLLNQESLQAAMQESVQSGVLLILEEMMAPGNETRLAYREHAAIKKIGEKIVERRYRKEKRPIYETKKVERLVPKRDDYGGIIGYEKKWVEVRASDKIVGHRDILVGDAEGDIVRKITVPILDRSNKMLPRGWYGMNAQAIVLLTRCGLGNNGETRKMARELERLMNMFGIPDNTWDQSWLAIAWMELAQLDDNFAPRRDAIIGRIIDGALTNASKKNPGKGMWGPVSIHHGANVKLFLIELQLQTLFQETEAALEAADKRKKKKLQEEFRKVTTALGEVKRATRTISQQGKRLSEVERPWKMNETIKTGGHSYYIYNRDITDIDSTAIVTMVLNEAKKRGCLPEITPRDKVQGKTLVRGIKSEDVIEDCYNALFELIGEGGNFHTCGNLYAVNAYDKVPNLAGVPLTTKLQQLLHPETWRSNAAGFAAIQFLDPLISDRTKGRIRDRDELVAKSRARVLEIIKAYLVRDPHFKEWAGPHKDETDSLKDLSANGGWPKQPKKKKKAPTPDINSLSVGYSRTPRSMLESLMVLFRQKEDSAVKDSINSLAYRLLIEQQDDGSWMPQCSIRISPPGLSSGEWAFLISKLARRHLWQAEDDKKKKPEDPLTEAFTREGPYIFRHSKKLRKYPHINNIAFRGEGNEPHRHGYSSSDYYSTDTRMSETLAALMYLSAGLDKHPAVDKNLIFELIKRGQEAQVAYETVLQEAQDKEVTEEYTEKQKAKDVKAIEKEGPQVEPLAKGHRAALHEVWKHILIGNGMDDRLGVLEPEEEETEEKAEDAEGEDAEKKDGDKEEEKEDSVDSKLDDILGGED